MKPPSRHTEWLSLIEVSGPFLAVSILEKAFPQGLEAVETPRRQRLRAAYEEWCDAVDENDPLLPDLHREWIRLVFTEILEYDDEVLKTGAEAIAQYTLVSPERTETFSPNWIVRAPSDGKPRLFISIQAPGTDLEKARKDDRWPASLVERMTSLCRAHGIRLGLITDGQRWLLVNAPSGATSSHASWYARLWFQEPVTLKAFQSLLGVRRCFGPQEETLDFLVEKSLEHQEEITDTLGEQVRRAVEVLVQCLDKADADRNRDLLHDVSPAELYEAGLSVMMRLVFVLCAEERGLLLSGDPVYDECYAVSTLRGQLAEEADRHGPEVLERRHDAWARLLAVFRAVHGGIDHESLRMPALGGSLFDPDRFPFLEGRPKGTRWRDSEATPLPIDNRTVLLLLTSLQVLEQQGGALLLSYRALDVEQIGHVYEGLLEHTVARVPTVTVGLIGSRNAKNPNLPLAELESARMDGEKVLHALLVETAKRSESAIRNALAKSVEDAVFGRLLAVCGGDTVLAERIHPYANLLRTDAWDDPIVYRKNAFMVTVGVDRRETGTHYTPKSLTESIVETALEPVAYVGPDEGKPRDQWCLKSSAELLDLKVCDPAMGSGAFLVQACRWLGERLVEAWTTEETAGKFLTVDGDVLDDTAASDPMPATLDERLLVARRLIAERCLYGVDVNPLAVELAKLSIWLVTLAKGRPFGFLDHNLRHGDSLLGIHRIDQLTKFKMNPEAGPYQHYMFGQKIENSVAEAIEIRKRLRSMPIRDIKDVEIMARLDGEARAKLEVVELIGDAMIGLALQADDNKHSLESALDSLAVRAGEYLTGSTKFGEVIARESRKGLSVDLPEGKPPRTPLHWPLEFPEVFSRNNPGFDAVIGNPPFLGNRLWKTMIGKRMQWLAEILLGATPGKIDLCILFHRRSVELIRDRGTYGLLATTNIAEGSAVAVGLGEIVKQGDIILSSKSFRWPGKASVTTAIVCFFKGTHPGVKYADGVGCDRIGPRLTPEFGIIWEPGPVPNAIFSFAGVDNSKGLAFVIGDENPWFNVLNNEKDSLLRPYITGNDITSTALKRIERWALDIADMSLDEIAEMYPNASRFLFEAVKPTRTRQALKSYKGLFDRWWQFWNHRADLFRRVRLHDQCVVFSKVTKHPICVLADPKWIYTNKVVVLGMERTDIHALCLSSFFAAWMVYCQGAKLGVGASLCLSVREAIDTYPLPPELINSQNVDTAVEFDLAMQAWCAENNCGVTRFADKLGDDSCSDRAVARARECLDEIDRGVAHAYGWRDYHQKRGFHVAPYIAGNKAKAFILSGEAWGEVIQYLLKLNRVQCEAVSLAAISR